MLRKSNYWQSKVKYSAKNTAQSFMSPKKKHGTKTAMSACSTVGGSCSDIPTSSCADQARNGAPTFWGANSQLEEMLNEKKRFCNAMAYHRQM